MRASGRVEKLLDFHLLEAHTGLSLQGQIEMKAKLPKDKGQTPSMVDVARHVGARAKFRNLCSA